MRTRTTLMAAAVLAIAVLLAWLTASGRLARLARAQEKQRQAPGQGASTVLPRPPEPFRGTIDLRAKDSKPDFPQPVQAPKGAPNILLVLLDDVGYGATST